LEPIAKYLNTGSPFLGICVGLQILFEGSDESPDTKGLGYFSGRLSDLANMNLGVPVPSVGWQKIISDKREAPKLDEAYLVHQFFVTGHSVEEMYSHYFYGDLQIPTHIGRGPVQGVQFHPEKSGERGLKFLQEVLASLVIGKTK
jgi:imidazole glycerol phosphate synthase glutamine amidotransferase subunit